MKALLIAMAFAISCATTASAVEVNLAVAASLKEVVNELADAFARNNRGVTITRNSGGTGILAKQLMNGARADIFIAANPGWIEYLQKKNVLASGSSVLAYNSLVFVAPPSRHLAALKDLTGLDRIAIGNSVSVPAGEYAMEALRRTGLDRVLGNKLVMARDVRECLMYAERGEVDGAFVYRTDALAAKRVTVQFTVPRELYQRVTYRMALTPAGAKNRAAVAFYEYLQGSEARAVLSRSGFDVK
jgi:molybdate transport system substrate-binding protein